MHRKPSSIPSVKITNYTYTDRIGCPYRKISSTHTSTDNRMCTKFLIGFIINACTKCSFLFFCNLAGIFISIKKSLFHAAPCNLKTILRNSFQRKHYRIIASLIFQCHWIRLFSNYYFRSFRPRKKSLNKHSVICHSRLHHVPRRSFLTINDRLDPGPVHIFIRFISHNRLLRHICCFIDSVYHFFTEK